jgi:hypothetical protein
MSDLTRVERDILSLLEEAFEERFSTILNTLSRELHLDACRQVRSAVINLLDREFVKIALARDERSLRQVPLGNVQALALIRDVCFCWSPSDENWIQGPSALDPDVILTDLGIKAARRVRLEDG